MEFNEEIIEFLVENFDLSEIEAQLYVGLLKKGPSTVMGLARFTGVNRATTHINLESLIEKGLVTQSKKPNSKRRILIAEEPKILEERIEARKQDLNRIEERLPNFVAVLKEGMSDKITEEEVKVRYYKGRFEVENMYDEILQSDEVRSYVHISSLNNVFSNSAEKFIEAHERNKKMNMWVIMDRFEGWKEITPRMQKDRFYYKFFPEGVQINNIDYFVYEDKVAVITLHEEPNGVIIENPDFCQSSKSVYDFMWQALPDK